MLKKIRPRWLRKLIYFALGLVAGAIVLGIGAIAVIYLPPFSGWDPQQRLSFFRKVFLPLVMVISIICALYFAYIGQRFAAWNEKGIQLTRQQHYDEALASFDRALRVGPKYVTPWHNKAIVFIALNRYDEALAAYNRALELSPKEPLIWNNKADLFCEYLKRYDEAISVCDEALARGISIAGIWAVKGEALRALGREAEARAAFEQVLTFHADDLLTWASQGLALAALGHYDEAVVSYDKAIAFEPENARLWKEKAHVLHALGREDEAREAEQQAEEIDGQP